MAGNVPELESKLELLQTQWRANGLTAVEQIGEMWGAQFEIEDMIAAGYQKADLEQALDTTLSDEFYESVASRTLDADADADAGGGGGSSSNTVVIVVVGVLLMFVIAGAAFFVVRKGSSDSATPTSFSNPQFEFSDPEPGGSNAQGPEADTVQYATHEAEGMYQDVLGVESSSTGPSKEATGYMDVVVSNAGSSNMQGYMDVAPNASSDEDV